MWTNKLELSSPAVTLEPSAAVPMTFTDLLNGRQAAAFLNTSYPRFLLAVRMGHLPEGVLIGGRKQWSKHGLATHVKNLFKGQQK